MDIQINAKVICADEECGRTTCVIIDPIKNEITHIVVREKGFVGLQRLVPIEQILESTPDRILLRCNRDKLNQMDTFVDYHYNRGGQPFMEYESDHYFLHPYMMADFEDGIEQEGFSEGIERIPAGELGVHRGATVNATDGKIGQVDEFLISPVDNHISHLVLREGHLWGKKLVTIPVSEIDRIETDLVYLKLNKQAVEKLPVIPVKR
jgi:uncharacterized protein YrrD